MILEISVICICVYGCVDSICRIFSKRDYVVKSDGINLSSDKLNISGLIDYTDDMSGFIEDGRYLVDSHYLNINMKILILRDWNNGWLFFDDDECLFIVPREQINGMKLLAEDTSNMTYDEFQEKHMKD